MTDLFAPRITDSSIDSRARYFRECAAMLDYFMTRGVSVTDEALAEIKLKAGILDFGIERRAEIPMAELIDLHATLARALSPALPSTIELLAWDERNSFLNWMAPVPAIRTLIFFTAFFLAVSMAALGIDGVAENYHMAFLDPTNTTRVPVALFFASLAALGACFSVLYDARKYVVEGTYDPRVGSNYIIRVVLGIVSGMILTQLLFDNATTPSDGTTATVNGIGKPLAALLGGFASQFVYEGLKRLVDALSTIFDASAEKQMDLREKEVRAEAEEKATLDRLARATRTMNVVAGLQTTTSESERSEALKELVQISAGGPLDKISTTTSRIFTPAHDALTKARGVLSAGSLLLEVLPGADAARLRTRLDQITNRVDDINHVVSAGAQGDLTGMATELLGELTRDDPARQELLNMVLSLSGPARLAGLAGGPAGIALAVISGTYTVGSAAYDRWKTRILDAPYAPDLLPPGFPDDAAAKHALDALPDIAEALGPDVMDDPAAMADLAMLAAQQRDDDLFAQYGSRFANDRAIFDAAVGRLRLQLVGDALASQVPPSVLNDAGATDTAAFFNAIDMARSDPEAEPNLEKLFLLAARARDEGDEMAIRELKQLLAEIGEEQTP
ncbi:hypothetical protein RGUI_2604 [Rhodovulum sp. P5]|uniref:hypothetical protein n=1 Tax=Rhodovulum sp. P5 TaxID=1564506 RepID=UPI0009C24C81|nr:hypothetical protein [Rhodovulum sp. P5]ARE40745.1 hypothetical protein RGUI_2604 [Rhodovulum sp. P5]